MTGTSTTRPAPAGWGFEHRDGVALVSGGTGGIGSTICRALVSAGTDVHFTFNSDERAAARLLEELNAVRPACSASRTRLSEADAVTDLIADVSARWPAIHTLVHAAGPHVPMQHLSTVEPKHMHDQVIDDVSGFFNLAHAAIPALRRSQGTIVAVTTAATSRFPKRDGLSSGPKAAVEALARALASEEGRYGIRVNCVGPGMLTDGMAARLIGAGELDEHALQVTRRNIPLGRFGTSADIADAVLFLASDRSAFITGQKLDVDGGYGV